MQHLLHYLLHLVAEHSEPGRAGQAAVVLEGRLRQLGQARPGDARDAAGDQQRSLGRVAEDRPALIRASGLDEARVVAQRGSTDEDLERLALLLGLAALVFGALLGAIGVSGDGIDQDDMIAFLGLSHAAALLGTGIGQAPAALRADTINLAGGRLRYVQCPQAPFNNSSEQNPCNGL